MIGYYIHHHGRGHLSRASSIARQCPENVVALSSLPEPDDHPFSAWIRLPDDPRVPGAIQPHAADALHWAPLNSTWYRERMDKLAGWVHGSKPRLVVVDVSVEVTTLVRSLGVPVVTMALPGTRDDSAHALGYQLSSLVIAPWPREIYEPQFLRAHAERVHFVGGLSRFDGLEPTGAPATDTVQLLAGFGGGGPDSALLHAIEQATGWRCRGAGGTGLPWQHDVWSCLCTAAVVVTNAGMSALAEVAAARRPAIVVAEDRPFDEQRVTARALQRAGLAIVLDEWPADDAWPDLLAEAQLRGGEAWKEWNDGRAASRVVELLLREIA